MKHLILLLLLFHPSSAGVYSKTLVDWCRSDHLIGDPYGLPANKRFDSKKNTCTQTFGIFDEKRAAAICQKKAPFSGTHSFDPKKGVTCVWETNANCPNDKSISFYNECVQLVDSGDCKKPYIMTSVVKAKFLSVILRDYGVKAIEIKLKDTAASHKMVVKKYGFGEDGFVKHAPEEWKPALVIPSEPMLKIPSGSIVRTDPKSLGAQTLCKTNPVRQSGSGSDDDVAAILSRNVYQPGVKTDMHDLDVMKFHKICAEMCDGCYASHEAKTGKEGLMWVPVRRKTEKKHDNYDNCNVKSDSLQIKQYFVQEFPGTSAVMADDTKWANHFPLPDCAAGPRSATIFTRGYGWADAPPFLRRHLFCTNGLRTDKGGKVTCIANSHPKNGVCECKKGFVDIHQVASGFKDEKAMYDKGMYCVTDCVKNSEHVGTACRCKKGFVDVNDVNGFQEEKKKYSKGQFCVEKISCGKHAVPNYETKKCDCNDGYIPRTKDKKEKGKKDVKAEYCVKRRICKQNSNYKDNENICECKKDYINIATLAETMGNRYEDGFCVKKVTCGANAHEVSSNGKSTNRCQCNSGFLDIHNSDEDASGFERGQKCLTTTTTTTKRPITKGVECINLTKNLRVVMVIDQSGSINSDGNDNWNNKVIPFIIEIGKLLNKEHTTVNLCFFSWHTICVDAIYPTWSMTDFENKVRSVTYQESITLTKAAMEQAFNIITNNGAKDDKKMILLVSDGVPEDGDNDYAAQTVAAVERMRQENPDVKVLAAGIGPNLERTVEFENKRLKGMEILRMLASSEDDAVFAGDFAKMHADKVKDIIDKQCKDVWG